MRKIERIFVHCTAGSQKQTIADLKREFTAKGWVNPGYHYVVMPDGKIEQLLDENKVSNGVQGYNSISINVAYIGGIDSKGIAVDNRTDAQKSSLRTLLKELKQRYPNATIMGHRDIWGSDKSKWKKMCPCFNAAEEYANIGKEEPVLLEIKHVEDVVVQDEVLHLITQTEPVEEPKISLFKRIIQKIKQWFS